MAKRTPKKRKYTPEFIKQLTEKLYQWCENKEALWLGEFASENRVGRQRLVEIAAFDDGFAEALEVAKQVQENKLFKIGIDKGYNASMAIFALKNVAGWRDEDKSATGLTEQEINSLRRIAKENVDV